MIFYASIRRELAQSFSAVLVVLLSIVLTMMLIRTLALANKGSVNPQDIFLIMSYLTLSFMPTILTLSLFLSVISSLVRWYQDSEMAVWFASGQGLLAFLGEVKTVALGAFGGYLKAELLLSVTSEIRGFATVSLSAC